MDLSKIRNMSDEELSLYLNNLSSRNFKKCSICGSNAIKVIKIENNDTCQAKKICGICDDCYIKLLTYLKTTDVKWGYDR